MNNPPISITPTTSSKCVSCGDEFHHDELRQGCCIDCWVKLAARFKAQKAALRLKINKLHKHRDK